jgi:hypothetical protein
MKTVSRMLLCAPIAALALALIPAAHAQVPYTEGNVTRVVHIHILAGHFDAFYADLKANVIPLFEAEKSAGLILSYRFFSPEQASSPDDWNFGYAVVYSNMGALDGLPDKVYDLRMKHYGDAQSEQKVLDKRYENAHLVSSFLIRDVTFR